jgi:hypothetical protein
MWWAVMNTVKHHLVLFKADNFLVTLPNGDLEDGLFSVELVSHMEVCCCGAVRYRDEL